MPTLEKRLKNAPCGRGLRHASLNLLDIGVYSASTPEVRGNEVAGALYKIELTIPLLQKNFDVVAAEFEQDI